MFHVRLAPGKHSYLKYSIEGGDMKILSTYTPEEFRGRGLAAILMEEAIKYAKENNLRIVPVCSYAKYYLEKKGNPIIEHSRGAPNSQISKR